MSTSPTKQSIPNLPPPHLAPSLLNPPSPRTHRNLRRLQSAHTLGQSNSQPSLISQQHKQVLQRNHSPANSTSAPHHSRGRSNSDATNMSIPNPGSAGRRPIHAKKPIAADALSLDRLVREGPPDGDVIGALESVRLKILDQGIKSDTDGMVEIPSSATEWNVANSCIVIPQNLRLAHSSQCSGPRNRRLPRTHPPWCLSCLL